MSKIFDNTKFWVKKHAPELLIYGGTALVAGAGVCAVFKTPKALAAIEESKKNLQILDETKTAGVCANGETYSVEDYNNDVKIVKSKTVFKVAKEYIIPAAMAVAGGVAVVAGVKLGKNRTAAAVSLATAATSSLAAYRANTKKRFGNKVDQELLSGKWAPETRTEKEEIVDPVTGEKKTVEKTVTTEGDGTTNAFNKYARLFDQSNPKHSDHVSINLTKLDAAQRYVNDLGMQRCRGNKPGFVFLNEVYEYLGFPMIQEGNKIGWLFYADGSGDTIDFGHRSGSADSIAFQNGHINEIVLTFYGLKPILDVLPEA